MTVAGESRRRRYWTEKTKNPTCPWDTAHKKTGGAHILNSQSITKNQKVDRETPRANARTGEGACKTSNSHQYLLRIPPGQRNGKCSCKCISWDFSLFLLFPAAEDSWETHCCSGALLPASVWLVSGTDPATESEHSHSSASPSEVLRWTFPVCSPQQRNNWAKLKRTSGAKHSFIERDS